MDKKTVLIIALLRTSTRIAGLAKYLPEFGWEPIVLTTNEALIENAKFRIIKTDYKDVLRPFKVLLNLNPDEDIREQIKNRLGITSKKSFGDSIITRIGELVSYPDFDRGWKPFAMKECNNFLQKENIDAIISSSSPITSHLIAKELKSKYDIPWIADLRDLWSQNHNYIYSPIRKFFDRKLEVGTLSKADAIITVSQPWAGNLGMLHKNKIIRAITNGFDLSEINTPPINLTPKFTITHTGNLYTGRQKTARIFEAISNLISHNIINQDKIEVRFYSPEHGWLEEEIKQYGLQNIVKQYGWTTRQSALEKQRESQVLLIINWENGEGLVGLPMKLFEYFAARRPIVSAGGLGNYAIEELLEMTKAGKHTPTVNDIEEALKEYYLEYESNGEVRYTGDINKIDVFSHREMAGKFAGVLTLVSDSKDRDLA